MEAMGGRQQAALARIPEADYRLLRVLLRNGFYPEIS
jgi:hypothetical protein